MTLRYRRPSLPRDATVAEAIVAWIGQKEHPSNITA
ncbi:hypothetical protein RLEG3_02790 (plasmid) [Rhizobium leguminosarum bv. trifolii WSM1689]|nr:hypothetical protein RLEG3_02790 [Rhizobium leguminosarum bv. trifolii WSM1689]